MRPRIHDSYLARQFVKILFYSIVAFTIIYVTVDIFEEIDNFIDHNASAKDIALYYLYSIPFILTYIIPISLLLGTVFSLGVLARRNELTALIASGVSLVRIAAPIIVIALVSSLASAWFNDRVVASANRLKNDIMEYEIEGRARTNKAVRNNFHYLGESGFVYLADAFNEKTGTLYDVVVQQFDGTTMIRRIDARRAQWTDEVWVFHQGFERWFEGGADSVEAFQELRAEEIKETPQDFSAEVLDEEDMTFQELRTYIERLRRSGGHVEKHLVDMYFKLSFPFAGSIFTLIGIAFAAGKRKHSVATGFGVTLIVAFTYYVVLRLGQTLGHNEVLPPLLAAQMGNVIFLMIGVTLLCRANR